MIIIKKKNKKQLNHCKYYCKQYNQYHDNHYRHYCKLNLINTMKITINKVYGQKIRNMINTRQKPTLPSDKFVVQLVIQNI